ncbi:hypothetical protein BZA05DRAFT_459805 [Tricharina praecox]|uniref:uncharacterized protein n=1 Tax=Tricharina praecox TaxID=43433 RepID=UPI00221EB95A|nr:uncharacterized protein BZA05DRAFT_459805 [Tricharina praecox]KAI5856811.1 hypothetical protein BZA05DRAFT_459805 [Tricharina praecox]
MSLMSLISLVSLVSLISLVSLVSLMSLALVTPASLPSLACAKFNHIIRPLLDQISPRSGTTNDERTIGTSNDGFLSVAGWGSYLLPPPPPPSCNYGRKALRRTGYSFRIQIRIRVLDTEIQIGTPATDGLLRGMIISVLTLES